MGPQQNKASKQEAVVNNEQHAPQHGQQAQREGGLAEHGGLSGRLIEPQHAQHRQQKTLQPELLAVFQPQQESQRPLQWGQGAQHGAQHAQQGAQQTEPALQGVTQEAQQARHAQPHVIDHTLSAFDLRRCQAHTSYPTYTSSTDGTGACCCGTCSTFDYPGYSGGSPRADSPMKGCRGCSRHECAECTARLEEAADSRKRKYYPPAAALPEGVQEEGLFSEHRDPNAIDTWRMLPAPHVIDLDPDSQAAAGAGQAVVLGAGGDGTASRPGSAQSVCRPIIAPPAKRARRL